MIDAGFMGEVLMRKNLYYRCITEGKTGRYTRKPNSAKPLISVVSGFVKSIFMICFIHYFHIVPP